MKRPMFILAFGKVITAENSAAKIFIQPAEHIIHGDN
jgi:hypothetical protein